MVGELGGVGARGFETMTAVKDTMVPAGRACTLHEVALDTAAIRRLAPGGMILTNDHVIAVAAAGGALQVRYSDGRAVAATLVGRVNATAVWTAMMASVGPEFGDRPRR